MSKTAGNAQAVSFHAINYILFHNALTCARFEYGNIDRALRLLEGLLFYSGPPRIFNEYGWVGGPLSASLPGRSTKFEVLNAVRMPYL